MKSFSFSHQLIPSVSWSDKELWGGFGLSLLLYVLGSWLGAYLLVAQGWQNSPWLGSVLVPVQLLMALPSLWIMSRYEGRFAHLGLDRFDFRMLSSIGKVLLISFSGMFIWGMILLPFEIRAQEPVLPLFGEGAAAFVSAFVVAALIAPVVEELVFRGFFFVGLRERFGVRWAVMISGAVFGAIHLQLFAFPVLFLLGILLALLYEQTGSLWSAIIMHFCINSFAVVGQYLASTQGIL